MLELFALLALAFAVVVAFQVLHLVLLSGKLALLAVKLVLVAVGFLALMALGLPLDAGAGFGAAADWARDRGLT